MSLAGMPDDATALVHLPPWAEMTPARQQHVERVAILVDRWAADMNTPPKERDRWLRAVSLHDALKDASDATLTVLSDDTWGIQELRHGPAAAVMAEREGESDRGVLDAVRFHSVGFRHWDAVGRMLYLGDALEPGRSHHVDAHAALAARVPADPLAVLRRVAEARLQYIVHAGMKLLPETVDFWNGLTCDA